MSRASGRDATTRTVADVGLLTGGSDKPYALGLAEALASQHLRVEFIGSDELDCPQVHRITGLRFLNLRGDQREDVPVARKIVRIFTYYARLAKYAAFAEPGVLHILWNNKFELFDRTVLMIYYRLVGKRVVLTAHNVNVAKRDARDSWLNRATLWIQYRLCDHVFVHTDDMKHQLIREFGVDEKRASVIPFGLNDTIPTTDLTSAEAKRRLGLTSSRRTLLFFGQIAPYKGLEYLIAALSILSKDGDDITVIVAGKIKRGNDEYWANIQRMIADQGLSDRVILRIRFIPDEEVEQYIKAADAVVIPYVNIFQSGVPFLAFSFGVPVIASDVGSLREDVVAETGMLCRPQDASDLAQTIRRFFQSELYRDRESLRPQIRAFGARHHSWAVVGELTKAVYSTVSKGRAQSP